MGSKMSDQSDPSVDARTALAGKLTETGHLLEARVYYAKTDFSGAVYHARYLEFLERGRIEYLRLVGVHHAELAEGMHGEQSIWIIRRMKIEFRQPARVDDLLTIETKTAEISGARAFLMQAIRRGGDILVKAQVECALIDGDGRPRRFPKGWRRLFRPQNA
jgi:acyl-CoA thioester hydrolase